MKKRSDGGVPGREDMVANVHSGMPGQPRNPAQLTRQMARIESWSIKIYTGECDDPIVEDNNTQKTTSTHLLAA